MCSARFFSGSETSSLTFDPEVFDGEDVLHLGNVGAAVEALQAPVPLVHHGPLGAAGQDEVGLVGDLHVLHVRVAVPRVERLV